MPRSTALSLDFIGRTKILNGETLALMQVIYTILAFFEDYNISELNNIQAQVAHQIFSLLSIHNVGGFVELTVTQLQGVRMLGSRAGPSSSKEGEEQGLRIESTDGRLSLLVIGNAEIHQDEYTTIFTET